MTIKEIDNSIFYDDLVTRRWRERHEGEYDDVSTMTNNALAEACTYCPSIDNPFARELIRRAGKLQDFDRAAEGVERFKLLQSCAKSFGIIIY